MLQLFTMNQTALCDICFSDKREGQVSEILHLPDMEMLGQLLEIPLKFKSVE